MRSTLCTYKWMRCYKSDVRALVRLLYTYYAYMIVLLSYECTTTTLWISWFHTIHEQLGSTFCQRFINLAIPVDRLCRLTVPRQKTSHGLWIGFYYHSQLHLHLIFGTQRTFEYAQEATSTPSRNLAGDIWCLLPLRQHLSQSGITACKEFLNLRDHLGTLHCWPLPSYLVDINHKFFFI